MPTIRRRARRVRLNLRTGGAALVAFAVLGGLGAAPAAQAVPSAAPVGAPVGAPIGAQRAEPLEYVALGDSFAAGPLIPDQNTQNLNLLCLRSNHDYPSVVAQALGAHLTDVSCSGATVDHFSTRQYGLIAPQYQALTADTDLVTLTIGGNDNGLVGQALSCINLLPDPIGTSCADSEAAQGEPTAAKIDKWASTLRGALVEIGNRSPDAKIVVAGYGTYLRPGGCWPTQPLWARDADHVQSLVNRLNGVLKAETEAYGAIFVDLAAVSVGHDTCAAPDQRYLEGLIPTSVAAPLHPNAQGMAAFGAAITEAAG